MNILLHSPLHPTYESYLIRNLKNHTWFIEPSLQLERSSDPTEFYSNINLQLLSKNSKIDVQLVYLQQSVKDIQTILRNFHIPIVFYMNDTTHSYFPKLPGIYPLIYSNRTVYPSYPDLRFSYVVPPLELWNEPWVGDKKIIFCPVKFSYYLSSRGQSVRKIIDSLEQKGLPFYMIKTKERNLPFKEWKEYFIHSRVLLDMTIKTSSLTLQEAMSIGMPAVTADWNDYQFMIRNKVDGFRSNSPDELYKILKKFLDNYNFAKDYGKRAKERANKLWNLKEERKIWNNAFKNAVEVFNKTGGWTEKDIKEGKSW